MGAGRRRESAGGHNDLGMCDGRVLADPDRLDRGRAALSARARIERASHHSRPPCHTAAEIELDRSPDADQLLRTSSRGDETRALPGNSQQESRSEPTARSVGGLTPAKEWLERAPELVGRDPAGPSSSGVGRDGREGPGAWAQAPGSGGRKGCRGRLAWLPPRGSVEGRSARHDARPTLVT